MKKALVTGANGFLGSLLVKELLSNGVEVIAAVREGRCDKVSEGVRCVPFEMDNIEKLTSDVPDRDIDVMFHLAWDGSFGPARADYEKQLLNVKYTCGAVETAAKMNIRRFVGAGTLAQMDCMAYVGENGSTPNAVSCYGSAKIAAQFMSKAVANANNIEHVWGIISNTYGIGNTTSNFVNFASKRMLNGERAAFTSGEQFYDFVYCTDTVHGLYCCGESGKNNHSYYIGSGSQRQLKEYITIIRDTIDPSIPLYLGEIPFNGKSLEYSSLDCSPLMNDTGYKPQYSFEEGIKKTVEWLKSGNIL